MSLLLAWAALSAAAPAISINGADITSSGAGSQTAGIYFESDGDQARETSLGGYQDVGDWITPKSAAPGAYEIRVTVNSGSLSTGTAGSWLALTSTRSWTVTRSTSGTNTANITVEIRLGVDVKASATLDITASVL